jgi:hypothetical protein
MLDPVFSGWVRSTIMSEYEAKVDEREGQFWAVVTKETPVPMAGGVLVRRTTTQEVGGFATHGEAARAGKELEERFEKLKAYW